MANAGDSRAVLGRKAWTVALWVFSFEETLKKKPLGSCLRLLHHSFSSLLDCHCQTTISKNGENGFGLHDPKLLCVFFLYWCSLWVRRPSLLAWRPLLGPLRCWMLDVAPVLPGLQSRSIVRRSYVFALVRRDVACGPHSQLPVPRLHHKGP